MSIRGGGVASAALPIIQRAATRQEWPSATFFALFARAQKKFKGTNALKRKVNPTRIPIEVKESVRWLENLRQSNALLECPDRCVHIGDRERDIYELFCAADELRTRFLVRSCQNRSSGDGKLTISDEMDEAVVRCRHGLEVTDKKGRPAKAVLEIEIRQIDLRPPPGKRRKYPDIRVTVIQAQERGAPEDREPIDWRLVTNLPIKTSKDAIEKLTWYAKRWNIETFHKSLKSGCKAEESKLRTADRLVNLISIFCVLSWRVFWLTMSSRFSPKLPPSLALTLDEQRVLDLVVREPASGAREGSLASYLRKIARLGGYLGRAGDLPAGNLVMWRGLSRLTDIELGFHLAKERG